jgi:hypothetical protein
MEVHSCQSHRRAFCQFFWILYNTAPNWKGSHWICLYLTLTYLWISPLVSLHFQTPIMSCTIIPWKFPVHFHSFVYLRASNSGDPRSKFRLGGQLSWLILFLVFLGSYARVSEQLKLGRDRFLSRPLPIIYLSSCHSTQDNLSCWKHR